MSDSCAKFTDCFKNSCSLIWYIYIKLNYGFHKLLDPKAWIGFLDLLEYAILSKLF